MITALEERVVKLLKVTIEKAIAYNESYYPEECLIKDILADSEVALHPEAIEELVEWLKESRL